MKIVKAHQTCGACPSQWDAWDANGRYVFLHFRHGYGRVWYYDTPTISDWDDSNPVASFEAEDGLDGVIELQDFCDRAGIELDLETRETSVYEFWPYKDLEMGP